MNSRLLFVSTLLVIVFGKAAHAGLPFHFEPMESGLGYRAVGVGYAFDVNAAGAEMRLAESHLSMKLLGAQGNAKIRGMEEQTAHSNYLIGGQSKQWRLGVKHFARVQASVVYPGIDVVYYGQGKQLEFDFLVSAGADPGQIRFRLGGAKRLRIEGMDLVAEAGVETLRWQKPVAYQMIEGKRVEVAAEFRLDHGVVNFVLGIYNQKHELVIDPVVSYSSYLGARGNEAAASIARDSAGNVYLTGVTTSAGLAVTRGAFQTTYGGETRNRITGDAFIAKFNAAGVLQYLTYLGGSGDDYGTNIGVDSAGNTYSTGFTNSRNFPISANAFQKTFGGSGGGQICKQLGDAYITKLDPTGSQIVYSTYLGGSMDESASSLLVDSDGSVYVTGATVSTNFPTTPGAYQRTRAGAGGQPPTDICNGSPSFVTGDGFVSKIDPTGSTLVFSTLIGGTRDDAATSIGLDANKNVYLAGSTISTDFPTTPGAYQRTFGGVDDENFFLHMGDGWVAKLNPTMTTLIYSTFLGGRQDDLITCMKVDEAGIVTVGGATGSRNFPTTATAISRQFGGYYFLPFEIEINFGDGFITRLNAAGSAVTYSTYVGGQNNDTLNQFWIDSAGLIYAIGWTDSPNFRTTPDALQRTFAGRGGQALYIGFGDGFLTVIDPNVSVTVYSTFIGGKNDDELISIIGDGADGVWIVGNSMSLDFPTSANATQRSYGGFAPYDSIKGDAVLMRIAGFATRVTLAAITNAASNALNIVSPGMVFVGYGGSLGPAALVGAAVDPGTGNLATARSGTRILFDGTPAPIVYVSAGQVSGIVPYSVASRSTSQVTVEANGQSSAPLTVSVAPAAPALFSLNFSGSGPAVVFNEDGSVNSATNPAAKGSIIVLYGTGEGQTTPAGTDGQIATSVFPKPILPVSVVIGNVTASEILYAGAVPGNVAGVLQVNARVAPTTPSGTQSLLLRVGSFTSQSGLTVFIR